jgi:alpha-glucosidase (family GH31 glycosyl hydrolase)
MKRRLSFARAAVLPLLMTALPAWSLPPAAPSGDAPLPASQPQFRHPEAAFIADFTWYTADLSGMRAVGALQHWHRLSDERVAFEYDGLTLVVTAPAEGVLRVQAQPAQGAASFPAAPVGINEAALANRKLDVRESANAVVVSAGGQQLEWNKERFGVRLLTRTGQEQMAWRQLGWRAKEHGYATFLRFALDPADHFFGLGGKTSPLDRRGRVADLYSVKVGDKRGDYGGFALPYFVNPRGYGFILNSPYPRAYFDFGYTERGDWSLTTPDGPLDLFLLEGPSMPEIAQRYHVLTGRPPVPPKWMLGLWVSWLTDSSSQDWLGFMRRFRDEHWPADVMVLDLYWRGGMMAFNEGGQGANLEWDRAKFADGPALIRALHDLNIHVVLHVNTRMFAGRVLDEGLAKGFLRRSSYSQVVGVLDDDAARDWNWQWYAPRVAEGVDGWWVDNGERVDGTLRDGLPSRNLYGEIWNRFLFDRMAAAGLENRPVLARGGWLGTQTNATQWPGDTSPGVERLREDLWFVGNLAMSGAPFSGVDLGGFNADGPDKDIMHTDENIIRRVAHGLLLFPIPRLHNHEKAPGKFPWRYNAKVQAVYREYLELRYRLFPYYYAAAVGAAKDSVPMIRPLVFDYPDDKNTYSVDDELLVGPSLLMAPVMETDAHARYVYLPEGEWFNYWTGENVSGGRNVLVKAELYACDGLPIFVKRGAIIPSRPVAMSNQEAPESRVMLDIYPADHGSCQLWENEETAAQISYTADNSGLHLQLENRTEARRTYVVRCRDGHSMVSAKAGAIDLPVEQGTVVFDMGPGERATLHAQRD